MTVLRACGLFLSVLIASLGYSVAQLDLTCFQNGGGVLVTPQNSQYSNDRLVFNQKVSRQPAAIAYAYNEAQVQAIIQCATANGFKTVPRGGGHGYEGALQHFNSLQGRFAPQHRACVSPYQ